MSAALEGRYRAALRWYPRSWRRANADAIVGTMLDQAEAEGRTVPLAGELRNLASSGVGARFERVAPQAVRDRIAVLALLLGSAVALVLFITNEWAPLFPRQTTHFADGSFYVPNTAAHFGPFLSGAVLLYGAWVLGLVAHLARQRVIGSVLLALTVPYSVFLHAQRPEDWAFAQPQGTVLVIFAGLALLTLVGHPGRPLPLPRLAVALAASIAFSLLGLLNGGVFLTYGKFYGGFLLFDPRSLAVILTALAALAAYQRATAWMFALLVSAGPWLLLVAVMATWGYLAIAAALVVATIALYQARRSTGLSSRSS